MSKNQCSIQSIQYRHVIDIQTDTRLTPHEGKNQSITMPPVQIIEFKRETCSPV